MTTNLKGRKVLVHDMCLRDGMHAKREQISVDQMVKVAKANMAAHGLDPDAVVQLDAQDPAGIAAEQARVGAFDAVMALGVIPHVVDDAAAHTPMTRLATCKEPGFLCLDIAPIAAGRRADEVRVDNRDGRIRLTLPPTPRPRTVLVAEMYRPEWEPPPGWGLRDAFGGLMFVTVPAGATAGELVYRPRQRVLLLTAAWVTIASSLLAIGLAGRRRVR